MKKTARKGASSTEVAILIGISVVIVALGTMIFYNNIQSATISGGMKKSIEGGGNTTTYTAENRDYASSQIDVQTMGAQGLEMLRRKANNIAIELIESTNAKDHATDIAYLSKALEIITGETHVCAYMKEDSDKHCDEFSKYKYDTSLGSNITIEPAQEDLILDATTGIYTDPVATGNGSTNSIDRFDNSSGHLSDFVGETIKAEASKASSSNTKVSESSTLIFPLTSSVISAISTTVYKDNNGYPTATKIEKIDAIIALTKALYYDISQNVVLIDVDPPEKIVKGTGFKDNMLSILADLYERMKNYYSICQIDPFSGMPKNAACNNASFNDPITAEEYANFNDWYNNLVGAIEKSTSDEEIALLVKQATQNEKVMHTIQKDTLNIANSNTFSLENSVSFMNKVINEANEVLPPDNQIDLEIGSQEESFSADKIASSNFLTTCYNLYNKMIDKIEDVLENTGSIWSKGFGYMAQEIMQTIDNMRNVVNSIVNTHDKISTTIDATITCIDDIAESAHNCIAEAKEIVSEVYKGRPVAKFIIKSALNIADVAVSISKAMIEAPLKIIDFFNDLLGN